MSNISRTGDKCITLKKRAKLYLGDANLNSEEGPQEFFSDPDIKDVGYRFFTQEDIETGKPLQTVEIHFKGNVMVIPLDK